MDSWTHGLMGLMGLSVIHSVLAAQPNRPSFHQSCALPRPARHHNVPRMIATPVSSPLAACHAASHGRV